MTISPVKTAALILAAGLSSRMGRPKQLLEFQGRILTAHVIDDVLALPELDPVVLVLGRRADEIQAALTLSGHLGPKADSRLKVARNPDHALGQSTSIRAGVNLLGPETQAALFVMADQPGLNKAVVERLLARAAAQDRPTVVRPVYGRRPGSPVWWARKHFPSLCELTGDQGGKARLATVPPEQVAEIVFKEEQRPWEIDTPADFEAWKTWKEREG